MSYTSVAQTENKGSVFTAAVITVEMAESGGTPLNGVQTLRLRVFLTQVAERALSEWLCADDETRSEMERIALAQNHGLEE